MSTTAQLGVPRLQAIDWSPMAGLAPSACRPIAQVLEGERAENVVDAALRANRAWSAGQRQVMVEAIFGVALWRLTLAWLGGAGDPRALAPAVHVFWFLTALAGVEPSRAATLCGLTAVPPQHPGAFPNWWTRWSVPEWLARHLEAELGEEAEPFACALHAPGPITLRVNLLRTTRPALQERLRAEGMESRPARFAPAALHLEGRPNILASPAHRAGLFEIQDEGSQLVGLLVGARPGHRILDACAGAGGKSLLLAAEVGPTGSVWAYDIDPERLMRLQTRAAFAGASNITPLASLPASLQADAVLVDAPCSSIGALRRGPDSRFLLQPISLERFPEQQRAILQEASDHVRPGGRLVYATCTLARAENQDRVARFLEENPDYRRAPLPSWLDPSFTRDGHFMALPHRHGTDGFFAAVLTRAGAPKALGGGSP